MCHAIPVIAFRTQGPNEIIQDKKNGYLINNFDCEEFADRIMELINDENKLKKMSELALKRSEDFSLATSIKKFKKCIEECLEL